MNKKHWWGLGGVVVGLFLSTTGFGAGLARKVRL